jgi:glycosyltransferase involved in cell wall biosynthesis
MFTHKETNPVRLLHIVGDSRYGGAAHIVLGLGRLAQAEGWQVDVLTTDPRFQQAVKQAGLGLVNLDVIRREISPLWDSSGLLRLRSFLRRQPYRIVHTHTSKGGFVGRLAAHLAGVPVIVHTVHGFAFHEQSSGSTRTIYSALERAASCWCDRIVSVSEFHRDWAVELGICHSRQIVAIPNGVAEVRRDPAVAPTDLRRRLGARADDFLVLSMARLASDKGLNHLIEALTLLPEGNPRMWFAIAGDGPVRAELEELARSRGVADRLRFLGHRDDIGDLLAAADLVVLPSLREGLSMTLLESMSAGKPIVATSIGSHREVASQADMARLVPPADPRALADAILTLAQDPALRARLAANARSLFEVRYTQRRMLEEYRQLYLHLLEQKCPVEPAAAGRGRNLCLAESPKGGNI